MMMLNAGCCLNMTFGCQYQGYINFDVYMNCITSMFILQSKIVSTSRSINMIKIVNKC